MATIQQQNESIEQHLFQPIQKYVSDSDIKFTELNSNGKLPSKTLGLIDPEREFLKNDEQYNGTNRMKQQISNRYVNDYNLYKVDFNTTNNECVKYNTSNCDSIRFNNKDTIIVENSLRKSVLSRDGNSEKVKDMKMNSSNLELLIPQIEKNSGEKHFNNDHRTKKSCQTQYVDNNILNNRFEITVPENKNDIYLEDQNGINTREYIRTKMNQIR